jgi:rubredoxin
MTTNNNHIEPDDYERVAPGMACPKCGEDEMDSLVWIDDDKVRCDSCGTVYDPNQPDAEA